MNGRTMQTETRSASRPEGVTGNRKLWAWGAGAAALAGLAAYNVAKTRRTEAENPPIGDFIEVDGVELHYLAQGSGSPIVLLHGNGATLEDWTASGLFDQLAANHRVIAFDRPGFGYSERPRTTAWTPRAQAALIARALEELGIERPLVVGHSFGTLVTLALALDDPEHVAGIVLIGGYFYGTVRADAVLTSPAALPVVGDAMRYTVSPLIAQGVSPLAKKKIFHPAPVAESFDAFPIELAYRPSQIRAEAAEAGMMIPAAAMLNNRLGELDLPVTIIAGAGDKMVFPGPQSERLHKALPGSRLHMIEGAGHMVHYTATDAVAGAIEEAARAA
jgi:pimeloyl-ACP methyl ester carboxylesterase